MEVLPSFTRIVHFLMVIFLSVHILECLAVQDFPQLDYVRTKYVCQNQTVNLRCPSPSLLEIQAASFGRAMSAICSSGANSDWLCDLLDKKLEVKQMCDYRSDCEVVANVETFGNDCSDVDKYLNIIYACVRNPDVEYLRTQSPTTQPITTQPSTVNLTTPPITNSVTQAPNITRNVTTSAPKPVTTPRPPPVKKETPPQTKVLVFNPDGPALDFLARAGETSISQGMKHVHTMAMTGVYTLVVVLERFL